MGTSSSFEKLRSRVRLLREDKRPAAVTIRRCTCRSGTKFRKGQRK